MIQGKFFYEVLILPLHRYSIQEKENAASSAITERLIIKKNPSKVAVMTTRGRYLPSYLPLSLFEFRRRQIIKKSKEKVVKVS